MAAMYSRNQRTDKDVLLLDLAVDEEAAIGGDAILCPLRGRIGLAEGGGPEGALQIISLRDHSTWGEASEQQMLKGRPDCCSHR